MSSVEPTPERLRAFVRDAEGETPVVMINLLRYREQAAYAPDSDAEPCSGRKAYERYAAVATGQVASVGGRMLWLGHVESTLIAPDSEEWDDAVLVQYPSRRAFLQMVAKPEYQAAAFHRTAALSDSRLIATTTLAGSFDS